MKRTFSYILLSLFPALVFAQNYRTVFDNVEYRIDPSVMINSVASDIAPFFVNDSIYFSAVAEKYMNRTNREKNNTDFYNVYSASVNSNGIITSRRRSVPGLNNEYHEGPADYCELTGELFITLSSINDIDRVQKMVPVENIRLQLAILKKLNGKWTLIEKLPFNENTYNFAQPAISITGDTLVFSSDLKPNYGKSDLFMSIRSNGEWSAPVNLGSEINTPGNELFPTFINGNLLSFSSNGQIENMGNLDIYYSVFPLTKTVHALPAPINSPNDDFGLKLHENKLVGYFVSNRNRNSSDDILMLEIKNLSRKFNGRIVDIDSNIPIANASVIFSYCTGGTINTVLTDNNGYFSNEIMSNECVEVEIISDGYEIKTGNITNFDSLDFKLKLKQFYEIHVFDSETNLPVENVQITNTENLNLQTNQQGMISIVPTLSENSFITLARDGYLIQELKPKPVGIRAITRDTVFMNKKQPGTVFFRKSIVENSEELKILEESTSVYEEIIKILELNPDLKVELGWHSDSRDTYSNNLRQTRNRSIFAVRYLENRGIEKNRVVGKGYGESQIINRCKNGVDCSEAEHSENRRIELKIIGFVEPDKENTEENSSEMINQQ